MSKPRRQEKKLQKRLGPVYYFARYVQPLAEQARTASESAVQHRGFKVGAIAVAVSADNSVGLLSGANYMPKAGGDKVCAERAVLAKARHHNFSRVVALVVSGPTQPDKHSGLELPTLHPCGDCRELLNESPLIRDDTLIMTVHPTMDIFELYNRRELSDIHSVTESTDAPDAFMHHIDPEFQIWNRNLTQLATEPRSKQSDLSPSQLVRSVITR